MMTPHPRSLDHLVLPVRTLEAAADRYRALGFQVGARNRHPWGTENHIIQFRSTFLEPIIFGDGADKPVARQGEFSFALFLEDFRRRFGQGFAMLVLASEDGAADTAAFDANGIGGFKPFYFERAAKRPDGSDTKVAFSLAFAADKALPDAGFFTCQQHNPSMFWNPAFQTHANGALDVTGVIMVAENPSDHHVFFSAFAGSRDIKATSSGVTIPLGKGGEIEVMTPVAYARRFGQPVPDYPAPRFVAFRVATKDMAAAWQFAEKAGGQRVGDLIVAEACGTLIAFEPAP